MAISVNIFKFSVVTERQPCMKSGQPAQQTMGVVSANCTQPGWITGNPSLFAQYWDHVCLAATV